MLMMGSSISHAQDLNPIYKEIDKAGKVAIQYCMAANPDFDMYTTCSQAVTAQAFASEAVQKCDKNTLEMIDKAGKAGAQYCYTAHTDIDLAILCTQAVTAQAFVNEALCP